MSSNFWNSCPLKRDCFPTKPCPLGKKGVENPDKGCEWFIDSEESCFCFWKYIRSRSKEDGSLDVHTLSKIMDLLKISQTKLNSSYKESIEKLKDNSDLKEYFQKSE